VFSFLTKKVMDYRLKYLQIFVFYLFLGGTHIAFQFTMGLWHRIADPKRKKQRILILSVLVLLEAICAIIYSKQTVRVPAGFLVRAGGGEYGEYIVAWRQNSKSYYYKSYADLNGALDFARKQLGLAVGNFGSEEIELERVWVQDSTRGFRVIWETAHISLLNQLTFDRESEAQFFADSFKRGGYSPSPFGHSLLLLPSRASN